MVAETSGNKTVCLKGQTVCVILQSVGCRLLCLTTAYHTCSTKVSNRSLEGVRIKEVGLYHTFKYAEIWLSKDKAVFLEMCELFCNNRNFA